MRHYSLLFAVTCLLVSLSSCEKKDYSSYPPTWKGFLFTRDGYELDLKNKDSIYAGDIITVTAVQDQKGHYINATTYYWDITILVLQKDGFSTKDSVISPTPIHTNYDGTDNGDPSFTFKVPSNALDGSYSKTDFKATYAYSGNGIQVADGGNYGSSSTITGSIHSTSGNQYGKASGSVRFKVYNK
jgi:hypothetical protein